jgi:hypothetical protein
MQTIAQSLTGFVLRLIVAAALGWLVALVYRGVRRDYPYALTFPPTLVILAVLIALVTHVIGDSIARAFSLVGALSIVRFRTVVEDTLDIGFVIFAVVAGMAAGASNDLLAAIAGTLFTGGVVYLSCWVYLNRPGIRGQRSGKVNIRVASGQNLESRLESALRKVVLHCDQFGAATIKGGSAVDLEFNIVINSSVTPTTIVSSLAPIEGVQNVEIKLA